MPLSLRTMIVRLPRRFSPSSSTVPSISAMTAGSFGLRASKISVTRGRPPVMSCVPDDFARRLGEQRAGGDLLAFVDFDVGLFGQVVEVENLAAGVFEDDLRVQVALVLHDHAADVAAGVLFACASFRLRSTSSKRTLPPTSARIGMLCGSHWQRTAPASTSSFSSTLQDGAGGNFVLLQLAALGVDERDFAVAGEHDVLAGVVAARPSSRVNLTMPPLLGLDVAFFDVRADRRRRCGTSASSAACPARRCSGRR